MLCRSVRHGTGFAGSDWRKESAVGNETRSYRALPLRLWGHVQRSANQSRCLCLKMILHDWNDSECVQVLQNIRRAAKPGGRVFVIEHIVPGLNQPHFSKLFDIHMTCWGRGRERT